MAWYKGQAWRDAIEAFDAWFYEATQYVNEDGDRKIQGFYKLTEAAIDAVIDVAHLDPMPVWEIYRLISDRNEYGKHLQRGYPTDSYTVVSIQEISDKLRLVAMYLYRMQRVGVTDQPGDDAVEIVSTNDARDEWMYQQKLAGKTHGQILSSLSKDHPDWEGVENESSVGKAVDRYCDRQRIDRIRRKRANEPL